MDLTCDMQASTCAFFWNTVSNDMDSEYASEMEIGIVHAEFKNPW